MFVLRVITAIVVLGSLVEAATAAEPAVTKADIPALVKEALMNDPEIIMQALDKLRAKKAEEAQKNAKAAIADNREEIFGANAPSAGASAKDADVTIVEFFDYHCGYCKHFLPEITKAVAEDKKLRVVLKDLPILSEDSALAARAAIAAHRVDKSKYFAFHTALMQASGKFEEANIMEIAKKVGIKPEALKAEMAKPEVNAALDANRALAQKLNINGTPGIIIGDDIIPGAMSYDELKAAIARAREAKAPAAKK